MRPSWLLRTSILLVPLALAAPATHAQDRTHVHTPTGRVVSVPGPGEERGSTAIGAPTTRSRDDGPRLVRIGPHHEVYGRPSTREELAAQTRNAIRPPHEGPLRRLLPWRPRLSRTEWQDTRPPTRYIQVGPTVHAPPAGRIVKPRLR